MKSKQSRTRGVILLALGLLCMQDNAVLASSASIKNRLNQQLNAKNLALNTLTAEEAQQLLRGLNGYQYVQTGEVLYAGDGDEQAQAAPVADEQAAQVQAQETQPAAEQAQPADAQQAPAAEQQAAQPAEQQPQAEQQVQAEAQVDTQQQAAAQAQAEAQAGAEAQAQAQAQAEAEAQAQAQAQAEAEAQAAAQAQAAKPRRKANVQVSATADVNQAAAVAAAAAQLIPEEKPFNKMNAVEKKAYLAKKAQEKAEKAAKEARENPTVDANGEHIQTVAEAKEEARQLQEMLVAGEAAVDQKIAMEQAQLAAMPATPAEPVKQEEDDGHIETVEEVKAKMAAAQAAMDQGLAETDNRVNQMTQENADMPNFGALADLHGSISNMGKMRKQKQLQSMAANLGVDLQPGEDQMDASDLTNTLIERAKAAGKTEAQIQQALAE